jgi:hypothetical protein
LESPVCGNQSSGADNLGAKRRVVGSTIVAAVANVVSPPACCSAIGQPVAIHLDEQIAENIAGGMSPEEARDAAMRIFGNSTVLREQPQPRERSS